MTSALTPCVATAQARTYAFAIPAKSLPSALVDFAIQTNLSIGADAAKSCRPTGNALSGSYTAEQGLNLLLAGTGCTYRMVDATTVRIVRARLQAPRIFAPRTTPAAASPAAPRPSPSVGELIVTSTKRSIALERAPFAVSAVSGKILEESGAVSINDIVGRIAGLTVTNLGPGRNKLFVRGLSDGALTGRTQSTVGLYFDDIRTTYNAPDPDLRLVDIERIELLRGPQGSLYGAGSIGGVLQIISHQPNLTTRSGWISGSGEATVDGAPGGVIEGGVNLPLVTDRLALRALFYREVGGGSIDDAHLGLSNVDSTVRQGARASLRWDINPNWSAGAGFIAQTIHTDDTHYGDASLPSRTRALFLQEPHRNDFDEIHLRLRGDFDWGALKANTAHQKHEINSRYDATLAVPEFSPSAPNIPSPYDEASSTAAMVSELTLASPTGGGIEWLGGLFSSEFSQTTVSVLSSGVGGAELYREKRSDDIDEYAAYGEATWRIWPKLSLTTGGRYFQLSVETKSVVTEPGAGPTTFAGRRTDHDFTPKVVVRYEHSDRMLFYVQAAEGYRAGGFNTSGGIGQGPQPQRLFTGDELTNLEIGARFSFRDGALQLRTALFQAHWENIQTDQLLSSGLPYTANIGDGHNRGLELEATYQSGGLRLDGNVMLGDPELDRANADFGNMAGRGLPGVPRLIAGAAARYEWGAADRPRRFVSAEASYVGSSGMTFSAAVEPRMGDYLTTRVAVGLISPQWRLTGYIENLLNSSGDTFAYGNPFTVRMIGQQTPQRPLTAGVILTRRF